MNCLRHPETVAPSNAGKYQYKVLDASNTGYYMTISVENKVYARCSTGTSCRVSKALPLPVGTEVSWQLELLTTQGNKVAGGFKTCLKGVAKPKKA